jgi:hypothetical protein
MIKVKLFDSEYVYNNNNNNKNNIFMIYMVI